MNKRWKKIKAAFVIVALAASVIIGSTQQCKASYYDNYYSNYQTYFSAYQSTGNPFYYYTAYAYLYYYYGGYTADYYGYNSDPYGNKSDMRINSNYYSSYNYSRQLLQLLCKLRRLLLSPLPHCSHTINGTIRRHH